MHNNNDIYDELKELGSPLVSISNKNVFTVPDGYFALLSSEILRSVHDQNNLDELHIPVLNMKVPEGYFEMLPGEIMNKIKSTDGSVLDEYPAFLSSVQHKDVFKVPDGYFDSLPENVLARLSLQPAKVVSIKPRSSVFHYAVAAAITGVLGLSLFGLLDNKPGTSGRGSFTQIAKVDEVFKEAREIINNNSFDKTMSSLSEDEIVRYLQSDGEDVNAALVASVTDEKTLPDEDAYFTDEQTLDNFLNEQHIVEAGKN